MGQLYAATVEYDRDPKFDGHRNPALEPVRVAP